LSSVISDYLYSKFRKEREGFLSKSRSNLVCRERLNELALEIGLDRFVHASSAENRHTSHIYGNALEALVGAIYIDRGYKYCRLFLLERVFSRLEIDAVARDDKNYKSRVIEWAQKNHHNINFNLLLEEQRKDGTYFVSEVLIDDVSYGRGEGFSKRESQQNAACEALKRLS
jgi:ribonuclease-3